MQVPHSVTPGEHVWPYAYFLTPITLTGCTFIRNFADMGGGFYYGGNVPVVTDCTFTANTAAQYAGAVHCTTGEPEFSGCTFTGNAAAWGGAVRSMGYGSAPIFIDCTFAGNIAERYGGGHGLRWILRGFAHELYLLWKFDARIRWRGYLLWGSLFHHHQQLHLHPQPWGLVWWGDMV